MEGLGTDVLKNLLLPQLSFADRLNCCAVCTAWQKILVPLVQIDSSYMTAASIKRWTLLFKPTVLDLSGGAFIANMRGQNVGRVRRYRGWLNPTRHLKRTDASQCISLNPQLLQVVLLTSLVPVDAARLLPRHLRVLTLVGPLEDLPCDRVLPMRPGGHHFYYYSRQQQQQQQQQQQVATTAARQWIENNWRDFPPQLQRLHVQTHSDAAALLAHSAQYPFEVVVTCGHLDDAEQRQKTLVAAESARVLVEAADERLESCSRCHLEIRVDHRQDHALVCVARRRVCPVCREASFQSVAQLQQHLLDCTLVRCCFCAEQTSRRRHYEHMESHQEASGRVPDRECSLRGDRSGGCFAPVASVRAYHRHLARCKRYSLVCMSCRGQRACSAERHDCAGPDKIKVMIITRQPPAGPDAVPIFGVAMRKPLVETMRK